MNDGADNFLPKAILDNLFDAVYYVDKERKILFWNKQAEDLTGFTRDEVVGKGCFNNILRHIDVEGKPLCEKGCPLSASLIDGQKREDIVFLHHKEGYRVAVQIRVAPVYNDADQIVGAVEIFNKARIDTKLDRQKELEILVYKDHLTQAFNRRFAERELKIIETRQVRESNSTPAVLFVDIDDFKRVNDQYSHEVGDKVLKMVSKSIQSAVRIKDLVCRWGGEEFLVIFPDITGESFMTAAERIRKFVETSFINTENKTISVTVSIGGTSYICGENWENCVKRADLQMYAAKRAGKNRVLLG